MEDHSRPHHHVLAFATLTILPRTVSEAPRPHEEIGGSGVGSWPRCFRYGKMKEAFPGLAPACYAFCIGDGWCPDVNADPDGWSVALDTACLVDVVWGERKSWAGNRGNGRLESAPVTELQ